MTSLFAPNSRLCNCGHSQTAHVHSRCTQCDCARFYDGPAPAPDPADHPVITKRVGAYDPVTRQYPAYVTIDDGPEQLIGACWSVGDVDRLCDEFIFHYLVDSGTPEAAAWIAAGMADEQLPLANFLETVVDSLRRDGYTIDDAPRGLLFIVDACERCQRLLNHTVYTKGQGYWKAYDWCDRCDRGREARVNWPEAPAASRLIPCAELHDLRHSNPAAFRARLAALGTATLEQQAAVYASYGRIVTGEHVTKEETLARFRRSIAIHEARQDGVCEIIYELALTDQPALIEFLRGHTAVQRDHMAWRFTAWLRRHHGIVREPAHIARGWSSLIVGASASGVA